jgi:phenylalanyl-tRNA synthetase beta chain
MGKPAGWLGALHPALVQQLALMRTPILFELDWDALATCALPSYKTVSRLPVVRRDLAVVVDAALPIDALLKRVRASLPEAVTEFAVFDVYHGPGIEAGKKSLAFRMLLQHTQKTLTDAEIEAAVAQVMDVLAREFAAVLRG